MTGEDDMIRVIVICTVGLSLYYCIGYIIHRLSDIKE